MTLVRMRITGVLIGLICNAKVALRIRTDVLEEDLELYVQDLLYDG